MAWTEILSVILLVPGAALMLLGAVGVIRLPDTYLRMSATSKAATLGVVLVLASGAVYFGDLGTSTRAAAAIVFMLITAPVAAHMLGRAAYLAGEPLWEGSVADELKDAYDRETGTLRGVEPAAATRPSRRRSSSRRCWLRRPARAPARSSQASRSSIRSGWGGQSSVASRSTRARRRRSRKRSAEGSFLGSALYTPSTLVALSRTSQFSSVARSAAAVSVVK